jgi:hypothetical protein
VAAEASNFPSAGRLERKLNCRYLNGRLTLRAFVEKYSSPRFSALQAKYVVPTISHLVLTLSDREMRREFFLSSRK